MLYEMPLLPKPFEAIKSNTKKIEVRLNYKGRDKIKVGDQIRFIREPEMKESIITEVKEIIKTSTFLELYRNMGADNFRNKTESEFVKSIYSIYSKEDEKKYGVLGFKIEVVNNPN